jgi:hypothetical protein
MQRVGVMNAQIQFEVSLPASAAGEGNSCFACIPNSGTDFISILQQL